MLILRRAFSSAAARGKAIALIMGKPGGGKGTLSKRIVNDFGFAHLSSGDMLRAHLDKGTELGKEAEKYMNSGALVPDQLMTDMVVDVVKETLNSSDRVLLDGFPRTVSQAKALDANVDIDFVFNLDVPNEEIVKRISDRWVHLNSGRVYSYNFNPPKEEGKDDETGEPLIRRADDEPEQVRKRLATYEENTAPVLDHYKDVLKQFSGDDNPELINKDRRSDAIYKSLQPYLQQSLK
uniref:Adenylate kinase active site lid domain-containing protein n=1 Tax=Aplanochytrium stocchinoi TaxID=215587 RepID=A0A7S3PIE4_9STRA|mmetsp:Transcript_10950/g.13714  ORF Transcript_10950/g.13714 Transcript_10950/m.13714 type:complete len:237 (-) Transcript_10950:81-791(-)|eukprot:CAMPEP_0204829152 /NCGR_PEP_ID=MMETSP1346-20131115/7199_1 /ASSEMBLY_ACC=CAM_ASM_000771 /TAXON_ID=215587 /ORGANISM="Aplanochytrium stocchinoi, Strain GSBS06" /LENGTH=236 /DNA_ID=CAMNT_0051958707 /DNA_START=187 /DNA_END=897 /DNA_ORIENTATION=-